MLYPLKFEPLLTTFVWGGQKIAPYKGIESAEKNIGESWELSGVEGLVSVVANGPLAGKTIAEVLKEYKGSIVFNIYKAGSQHVDHVENQYFYGKTHPVPPCLGREELPEVLRSEAAMALWKKARAAGYVDENYQPLISRTQAALLADAMAERLGIKEKWKVFETFWGRKNMYRDYYKALNLQQSLTFQDDIKKLFH